MAIDTAAKRRSCIGIGLLFLRTGIAPTGGGLSSAGRLHVQGLYVGITPPAPPTAGYGFMVIAGRDEDEMLDVFLGESESLIDVFEDQGA